MSQLPPLVRPKASLTPSPAEVASWLGGELKNGDGAPAKVTGVATLDQATADEIGFFAGAKNRKAAEASAAGLLIVAAGAAIPGRACVEVKQVWPAVATLLSHMYPEPRPAAGIHPTAVIGEGARIAAGAAICANAVIGEGAEIGDDAVIGPGCVIGAGCKVGVGSWLRANVTLQGPVEIGRNVIIHPGVVIGADGFRYESGPTGALKIPQVGVVIIEDDVEIGANTTIDRAFLHETRIGRGSKIDNQVQIGHNVRIGAHCVIAGCAGISGSTTLGDGCIVGGRAGIADGITIGAGSIIGAAAGVGKDLPPRSFVSGAPARPLREHLRSLASLARLPKLVARVAEIEKRMGIEADSGAED